VNVELPAPDGFAPALPGWDERSPFIGRCGPVEFFHYDLYGQALSTVLRGHQKDIDDARALVRLGKVEPSMMLSLVDEIEPELMRYPALNPAATRLRAEAFVHGIHPV
jgi:hypothetical protein